MNVTILGSGAYGIALALMFYKNNCNVLLWTKFEEEKQTIINERCNKRVLPDVYIPDNINITTSFDEAISSANIIVIAVPAGVVDDISFLLSKKIKKKQHVLLASKGIEQTTCLFCLDILKKYIKTKHIAVLSGASFACDIADNFPVGLNLATKNKETENIIKDSLQNDTFKVKVLRDLIGVQVCGAIKNVIAIASGILDGMGYPESTQAMFITESIHDISELIKALGGNRKTILSYAGIGDLLLTTTSKKSRNYQFGYLLGSKANSKEIDKYKQNTTIEGLYTVESIYKLLNNKKLKIPVISLIYDIVNNIKPIEELPKMLINK